MNPYTQLEGFEQVVLEESYVLGVCATPGVVVFDLDAVLTPRHPAYEPPTGGERDCFKPGRLEFTGVTELFWSDQGLIPAVDATGQKDYGHIDYFGYDGRSYTMQGDWGNMRLSARRVSIVAG